MHGRMIHNMDGSKRLSRYSGRQEDYINSVSRPGLNIALLNKAEEFEHLRMYFNAKCTQVDLNNSTAHFTTADGPFEVKADIIIGTDGAGSAVRGSFMKKTTQLLFNFSQDFLRSGYKELTIPPTEDGRHRIEKNALHIWPRGQFMMIALPNLDGSFTVTLFHPYEGEAGFNTLNGEEKLLSFFKKYYPDSLEHMPELWEDYKQNPVGVLGTIKCYPWQAFGKNLIMGDAAHAIVPFYGQGMNASFEDVRVFDEILDAHEGDWPAICYQFQEARYRNTNAIADLAMPARKCIRQGHLLIAPGFRLGNQAGKKSKPPHRGSTFLPRWGGLKQNLILNPSLKPGAIDISFLRNVINTCTISRQIDDKKNSY
jgi:kynurenine 3-monooxygenase